MDVIFSHEIKKLPVLPFVPVTNVISIFEKLITSNSKDTWIERYTCFQNISLTYYVVF